MASETNDGTRLNESRIKALSVCERVTKRFLNSEFFTFEPVAKFWLSVNHKPIVRDDSHGFWRRIRLIPFTQVFSVNASLGDELAAEASGILGLGRPWLSPVAAGRAPDTDRRGQRDGRVRPRTPTSSLGSSAKPCDTMLTPKSRRATCTTTTSDGQSSTASASASASPLPPSAARCPSACRSTHTSWKRLSRARSTDVCVRFLPMNAKSFINSSFSHREHSWKKTGKRPLDPTRPTRRQIRDARSALGSMLMGPGAGVAFRVAANHGQAVVADPSAPCRDDGQPEGTTETEARRKAGEAEGGRRSDEVRACPGCQSCCRVGPGVAPSF